MRGARLEIFRLIGIMRHEAQIRHILKRDWLSILYRGSRVESFESKNQIQQVR
jgi:hypothetical protein